MLQRLQELASESKMQNKHAAAVVGGGKMLSSAVNSHDCRVQCGQRGPSTHAEEAALRRFRSPHYWEKQPQWVLQKEATFYHCCSN